MNLSVGYVSDLHLDSRMWWRKVNMDDDVCIIGFIYDLVNSIWENHDGTRMDAFVFLGDVTNHMDLARPFVSMFSAFWSERSNDSPDCKDLMHARWEFNSHVCQYMLGDHSVLNELMRSYRRWVGMAGSCDKPVFWVLGDDECTDFRGEGVDDPVSEAISAWKGLLSEYGMHLLHMGEPLYMADGHINPLHESKHAPGNGIIFAGDVGYRLKNKIYDDEGQVIWQATNDESQEDEHASMLNAYLEEVNTLSLERGEALLFATHVPTEDWCLHDMRWNGLDALGTRVTFFHGDDHRNRRVVNRYTTIIADGYFEYKRLYVAPKVYQLCLGGAEIQALTETGSGPVLEATDINRYKSFLERSGYGHDGVFTRLQSMLDLGAQMYRVTSAGVSGWFVEDGQEVWIMNGKMPTRTGERSISGVVNRFDAVVQKISGPLESWYGYMEQVSDYVCSIGGTGNIHGCIVDFDFYNHVMVNPSNGEAVYYHSPEYLSIQAYRTAGELLENHMPNLWLQCGKGTELQEMQNSPPEVSFDQYLPQLSDGKCDYSSTVYPVSNAMVKLQKLKKYGQLVVWPKDQSHSYELDADGMVVDTRRKGLDTHSFYWRADEGQPWLWVFGLSLESMMRTAEDSNEDFADDEWAKKWVLNALQDFAFDLVAERQPFVILLQDGTALDDGGETFHQLATNVTRCLSSRCDVFRSYLERIAKWDDGMERLQNCLSLWQERYDSPWEEGCELPKGSSRLNSRIRYLIEEISTLQDGSEKEQMWSFSHFEQYGVCMLVVDENFDSLTSVSLKYAHYEWEIGPSIIEGLFHPEDENIRYGGYDVAFRTPIYGVSPVKTQETYEIDVNANNMSIMDNI